MLPCCSHSEELIISCYPIVPKKKPGTCIDPKKQPISVQLSCGATRHDCMILGFRFTTLQRGAHLNCSIPRSSCTYILLLVAQQNLRRTRNRSRRGHDAEAFDGPAAALPLELQYDVAQTPRHAKTARKKTRTLGHFQHIHTSDATFRTFLSDRRFLFVRSGLAHPCHMVAAPRTYIPSLASAIRARQAHRVGISFYAPRTGTAIGI